MLEIFELNFFSASTGCDFWYENIIDAVEILADRRNATSAFYLAPKDDWTLLSKPQDLRMNLKMDVDLYSVNFLGCPLNLSEFDFTPGLETAVLFVMVPRRGFVPSYLAALRCFTPTVWVCTISVLVTFLSISHVYNQLQIRVFPALYKEVDLTHFERVSVLLTLYRHVLNISQPRWELGALRAGKILFLVFSFSTLILTSLFASSMMSALTEPVRYSDINTLRDLNRSEMFVQTDTGSRSVSLSGYPEFEWLTRRLSDHFQFEAVSLSVASMVKNTMRPDDYLAEDPYFQTLNASIDVTMSMLEKNLDVMLSMDAFLVEVTASVAEEGNVLVGPNDFHQEYEFHFVREYITSYPYMNKLSKNSFYRDAINDILTRMLEGGFTGLNQKKQQDHCLTTGGWRSAPKESEQKTPPRAFSLVDLRIAFLGLGFGLGASIGVFLLELLHMI
ncbi:unnamed protein product [Bemisia tabaci]|uniref:Ionotropic receptor n=1 Tax=Bemisia tabaci TaxID=7038 RepID=A0A9P0A2U5_BEMTA|nr:unnamed protein product [Bemisia tabaci]